MARLPGRQEAIFIEVAKVTGWRLNNDGTRKAVQELVVVTMEPFLDYSGNYNASNIHRDDWIFPHPVKNSFFL